MPFHFPSKKKIEKHIPSFPPSRLFPPPFLTFTYPCFLSGPFFYPLAQICTQKERTANSMFFPSISFSFSSSSSPLSFSSSLHYTHTCSHRKDINKKPRQIKAENWKSREEKERKRKHQGIPFSFPFVRYDIYIKGLPMDFTRKSTRMNTFKAIDRNKSVQSPLILCHIHMQSVYPLPFPFPFNSSLAFPLFPLPYFYTCIPCLHKMQTENTSTETRKKEKKETHEKSGKRKKKTKRQTGPHMHTIEMLKIYWHSNRYT